jgi:hypothetical protein
MFPVRDLKVIQAVVDKKIVKAGEALTAKELYALVAKKLKTKVAESGFGPALTAEIAAGNVVGIEGKRKVGYCRVIRRGRPAKPAWLKNAGAAAAVDAAATPKKRGRPAKPWVSVVADWTPDEEPEAVTATETPAETVEASAETA